MKKDEAKQLADNAIKALQEELKAGHSEKLIQYLNAMSRFHSLLMDQQSADRNAESGGNAGCGISTLAEAGSIRSKR